MNLFSFGKRRRSVRKSTRKVKPPARLLKMCKKYRIKATKKVGRKRVYRSVTTLKKLLRKKMKKNRKVRKVKGTRKVKARRTRRKVRRSRRSGFGLTGYQFSKPDNYGFNQLMQQSQGVLPQTSYQVNQSNNNSRPEGFVLPSGENVNGVNREFFGQQVPTQVPPNWLAMGQPDGTLLAVGTPFQSGTKSSFGYRPRRRKVCKYITKRRKRYNVAGSQCNIKGKAACKSNPNCSYTRRGCRRRAGTLKGMVYEGPSLPSSFGYRRKVRRTCRKVCRVVRRKVCRTRKVSRTRKVRRCTTGRCGYKRKSRKTKSRKMYNVLGSQCNGLSDTVCKSNPNCSYTKRGCRRRAGTLKGGLVYEGPSLPSSFGYRRKTRRTTRRRRYNVAGSQCNIKGKAACKSNPNCSYTKRGCRRRAGTVKGGLVYEGPSLPSSFGYRRSRFGNCDMYKQM